MRRRLILTAAASVTLGAMIFATSTRAMADPPGTFDIIGISPGMDLQQVVDVLKSRKLKYSPSNSYLPNGQKGKIAGVSTTDVSNGMTYRVYVNLSKVTDKVKEIELSGGGAYEINPDILLASAKQKWGEPNPRAQSTDYRGTRWDTVWGDPRHGIYAVYQNVIGSGPYLKVISAPAAIEEAEAERAVPKSSVPRF